MLQIKSKMFLYLLFFLAMSCVDPHKKENKLSLRYIGDEGYKPDSLTDLRNNTVVLAFTTLYRNDSIEINSSIGKRNVKLNTNEVTGLADILELFQIKKQEEILVKFNNQNPFTVTVNKKNQIFVIKHKNDSLLIESVYYLPKFE